MDLNSFKKEKQMPKEMTRVQILRGYFFREGKDTLTSFLGEMKALSSDERDELAQLAAKQMDVAIKEAA